MQNKKIFNFTKISIFAIFLAAEFFNFVPTVLAEPFLQKTTITGNKKILTWTDQYYSDLTLKTNINVQLTFLIQDKDDPNKFDLCPAGKQIYAYLKHWSGQNVEYVAEGQHINFSANFNTGPAGQINKYAAIFACNAGYVSGAGNIALGENLADLESQGLAWKSEPLQLITSNTPSQSTVIYTPAPSQGYFSPNTRVVITLDSPVYSVVSTEIIFNQISIPVPSNLGSPYPFYTRAGEMENLNLDGSKNTIEVVMKDRNGNKIVLGNNPITFQVGASPAPAAPPAGGAPSSVTGGGASTPPPANCGGKDADPNRCLYNPLPEDSLTATLLLITKGFLGIIGLWAVAFIIFGGFQYVMSAGSEEAILKARKTITWAVIGLIVALLSFSIVSIIQNLLKAKIKAVENNQTVKNVKV